MKTGFVTCVQLGLSCLEKIYSIGGKLDLIITLKDDCAKNKSGRIYLDDFCKKHGVDLIKIKNVNEEIVIKAMNEYNIDWLFIIGWSQIAKSELLYAPRKGVLGMHPTLLPEGRGRAAIPWAILNGLERTGVTLFKLNEGVDTGPIILQEEILIANDEIATTLYKKVQDAHSTLISKVWPLIIEDKITYKIQDETKASIWPERKPADGEILPNMTVKEVEKLVRAVTRPYPGAFMRCKNGIIKVWKGEISNSKVPIQEKDIMKIDLHDGCYIAQEYEIVDII